MKQYICPKTARDAVAKGKPICLCTQIFKLDWVLMSIFILCLIAMALYKGVEFLEQRLHVQHKAA